VAQAQKLGFFDRMKVRDAVWRGRAVDDLDLAVAVRRQAEEIEEDAAHWSWHTRIGRRAFMRSYLSRAWLFWLGPLLLIAVNISGYLRKDDLFYLVWALLFLLLIPFGAVVYARRTPCNAHKARLANRSLFEE
jgi:hypothetical protein